MAAVQLADGVWRVPVTPYDLVNTFLLEEGDGSLTLVDAGLRGSPPKVLAAVAQLGRRPGDVQRVLLSHAHADHAGGLAAVRDAAGGPDVRTHEREAAHVREGRPPAPDNRTLLGRLLARTPQGFAPSPVAATFADGDVLPLAGGVRVVHTPGHTPGHCSFLLEDRGVLLTGDAVVNVRGLRYAPAAFCSDVPLSRETAARLGELDYAVAGFTHGREVATGARAAVRAFTSGRRG